MYFKKFAETIFFDELTNKDVRGDAAIDEVDGVDDIGILFPRFSESLDHLVGFFDGNGKGLFAEDVLTGGKSLQDGHAVELVGQANVDVIGIRILDRLVKIAIRLPSGRRSGFSFTVGVAVSFVQNRLHGTVGIITHDGFISNRANQPHHTITKNRNITLFSHLQISPNNP